MPNPLALPLLRKHSPPQACESYISKTTHSYSTTKLSRGTPQHSTLYPTLWKHSANQAGSCSSKQASHHLWPGCPESRVPSGHLLALARKRGSQEKGGRTQGNFQKPGRVQTAGKLQLVHSPPRKSFNNTARPATLRSSKFPCSLQDGSIPAAGNGRFGAEAATAPNPFATLSLQN